MATMTQTPVEITITLVVERNQARTSDLETFLTREIKKAMSHAQYTTPAASKMLSFKIESREKPAT